MELEAALLIVQRLPGAIAALNEARKVAAENDIVRIDAALDAAKTAALSDVAQAQTDLAEAAKSS